MWKFSCFISDYWDELPQFTLLSIVLSFRCYRQEGEREGGRREGKRERGGGGRGRERKRGERGWKGGRERERGKREGRTAEEGEGFYCHVYISQVNSCSHLFGVGVYLPGG